jgi:enoyl-CoA hydratase/carnithine racemase
LTYLSGYFNDADELLSSLIIRKARHFRSILLSLANPQCYVLEDQEILEAKMGGLVNIQIKDFIGTVTINRPEVRNALSSDVIKEIAEGIRKLSSSLEVRVVIFTGEGDKAFSAGADLKERQKMSERETLDFVTSIQRTWQTIAELPMPTIAAINGDAFGGGLELALACDIRIMSTTAMVGLPECSLGIIPGAGGTQRLPRIIGFAHAMDMIFSARRISAEKACDLGLINYLASDPTSTRILAHDHAKSIASNAPLAIRAAKRAIIASLEKNLREGLVEELASYHEILETADRKEGLMAFQEKRKPIFQGK